MPPLTSRRSTHMGLGFGIRLGPVGRVRISTRGLSAGIGPRIGRVNVGTRGVGVSSGLGPFSASVGTGWGGGGSRGARRAPSMAAYEREVRRVEKEAAVDAWDRLNDGLDQLRRAHEEAFRSAKAPYDPGPAKVDTTKIREQAAANALLGLSVFQRKARAKALAAAESSAAAQIQRRVEEARANHAAWHR